MHTERVLAAESLPQAFEAWRWRPELNVAGNITNIYHTGWKIGDYEQFFEAIAPWVQVGSFVRIHGEDGLLWHFAFDGLHARYVLEQPGAEHAEPLWPALGAHAAFVAARTGLAEQLAGPATVTIAGRTRTPAEGVALAREDANAARAWMLELLARRAKGEDPGDRALRVALRALPLLAAAPELPRRLSCRSGAGAI